MEIIDFNEVLFKLIRVPFSSKEKHLVVFIRLDIIHTKVSTSSGKMKEFDKHVLTIFDLTESEKCGFPRFINQSIDDEAKFFAAIEEVDDQEAMEALSDASMCVMSALSEQAQEYLSFVKDMDCISGGIKMASIERGFDADDCNPVSEMIQIKLKKGGSEVENSSEHETVILSVLDDVCKNIIVGKDLNPESETDVAAVKEAIEFKLIDKLAIEYDIESLVVDTESVKDYIGRVNKYLDED